MTTELDNYKSTDDKLEHTYVTMWNFNRSYPCYHFKGDYWNGFINPLVSLPTLMQIRREIIDNHRFNYIDEHLADFLDDYLNPDTPSLMIDNQVYYYVGGGLCWDEMEQFEDWKDMETNFLESVKFVPTSESHMSHLEAEYMIHYLNDSVWIAKMEDGFYTCCEKEEFTSTSLYDVEKFLMSRWVQYEHLHHSQQRTEEVI